MPWLSWHACELVNYRLKPAITFLHCVFLCLSVTTLSGSSAKMGSISAQPRTMRSCSADGCQECPPSAVATTRPYLRTALARSVYSKILVDEEFKNFDRTKWYKVNVEALEPEADELFLELDSADAETQVFLERCQERSDAVFTQLFHLVARTLLAPFVSQTSINGILRRGSMFVISDRQFRKLFHLADDYRAERMLDLGAGDGATTALLAGMFDNVHVTEMSWPMKRILAARGFTIEDVEGWSQRPDGYDVICALNLLDRCSRPLTLLEQMKTALKPNGLVLVALAWPFRPYVEFSATGDHQPEQVLDIDGQSFEEQAVSMMRNVLKPLGFRVVSWSRLPYLCEGDLERTFYHLNDMIFALKLD
ncbi:hypothetical protein GHT06_017280 [Daphnia sinensis]|uniref:Methyltransferase-like protein 9 n=1 Tax=Daphnia sinensis TaxID=1820382 RepID=A0AAD5KRC1_9CRUS|nr:hypothetical protein GHT06_017280 [Daphnia sinensis]